MVINLQDPSNTGQKQKNRDAIKKRREKILNRIKKVDANTTKRNLLK